MRVLVFSWEYPPKVVGGLARHVKELYQAMSKVKDDLDIHIITCGTNGYYDNNEMDGSVHIHRVEPRGPRCDDFVSWVSDLSFSMLETAIKLLLEGYSFDIVHVHDWLAAHAAITMKHACKVPLITTIHATEWGRNSGIWNQTQKRINDIEWHLCYESWKVIVCSNYMSKEVEGVFGLPKDKVIIMPNAVDIEGFNSFDQTVNSTEKYLFYVGRLVNEKGVLYLLDSFNELLRRYPLLRLKIAGTGPQSEELKKYTELLGISQRVDFLGFIDDKTRNSLYRNALVAVVPSTYEPFGITALEAMANKAPLVVSDVGGLSEIVEHGINGLKFYPKDVHSLSNQLIYLLENPNFRKSLSSEAYKSVQEKYNWKVIAKDAVNVYEELVKRSIKSDWHKEPERESVMPQVYSN